MIHHKPTYPFRKKRRRISPLTVKILAVNIGALFMLALGFLYTAQYEDQLIEAELNALNQEAKLIAAALSEGGVRETIDDTPILARDLAQLMIRKISTETDFRIFLFNNSGELIADSHRLSGAGGVVQIFELPPPAFMQSWHVHFQDILTGYLKFLPTRLNLKKFPSTDSNTIQSFPDMIQTLQGEDFQQAWHDENDNILLVVNRPVARLKQVLGGIMVVRTGERIENAITDVQINVLRIFFGTLAITVFFSIYLSTTIGTPIRRLSFAADRMRALSPDSNLIPDFSARKDEIGDLSLSLRHLTDNLKARMNAIESFAADVAHELKNPLASLQSAVETLPLVKDDKTRNRLQQIIHNDVQRLDRLITDISAASRLDAELGRDEKSIIDLLPVLKTVIDHFDQRADRPNPVKLLTTLSAGQSFVSGHEGRLGQVFSNILANAVSFSPTGAPITVRLIKDMDTLLVMIENKGPEIPENKMETIFNRFYTERPEENSFGRHSGLGLSISRQIIHAHQGDIRAENMASKSGRHLGVRFTVSLPVHHDG